MCLCGIQDLGQIHDAGLNMIRHRLVDRLGQVLRRGRWQPYERTLRTLEAYLMTARKYSLPVQFNFFAFLPDVLGGTNAFLDPQAVRRQKTLIAAVVARFHYVPYLAWDLINEPSFSQHLWTTRPNGDPIELAAWNGWLSARYPDRAKLAALWNVPFDSVAGTISLPVPDEFLPRGVYAGTNSLRIYDYFLFAQEESFAKVGFGRCTRQSAQLDPSNLSPSGQVGRRGNPGPALSGILGRICGFHDESFLSNT